MTINLDSEPWVFSNSIFFYNGNTGCLLRLSGRVERGAGDVTVLVPSEAG